MSKPAENNQKVQTIELTLEQSRAISSARSYFNFYIHDLSVDIQRWKEKGIDCSVLEKDCKKYREQIAVIDSVLEQAAFPSNLS